MNLPSEEQCFQYFEEYKVPQNIKEHCLKVKELANFLAKKLKEVGVEINLELVDRAAFLHDIFKVVVLKDIKPNKYHQHDFSAEQITMWKHLRKKYPHMYEGEVAYLVFKDDFPELALALKNGGNPRYENHSWEELVVHYADFRIFRGEVVPLKVREAYIQDFYPAKEGVWEAYFKKIKKEEEKIFNHLNFNPEELKEEELKNV